MYNLIELEKFLNSLEEFYKTEPENAKKGIGHEIEHINGVMLRSKKYTEIVNQNFKVYGTDKKVDIGKMTIVAALHDIGNVIERDYHNHYGMGIVKGDFNVEDFCRVPLEITKGHFADKEFLEDFKTAISKGVFNEDEKFEKAATKYYTAKLFFDKYCRAHT